jgi:hypothetical protein
MISFLIRGEENVHIPEVVSVERTGHPSQPKKNSLIQFIFVMPCQPIDASAKQSWQESST